jgi:hypothetical protein
MEKKTSDESHDQLRTKQLSNADVKRERYSLEKSKSSVSSHGHAKLDETTQRRSSLSEQSSEFDPSVYDDTSCSQSIANSLETMPIVFLFK